MKKKHQTLWGLLLSFIFLITGCTPSTKSYLAEGRNEKWINDISYVEKALPKVHKNLYFHLSKEDFINQLEDLKKKVPTYSDKEIEIELSKVVASVGDSHTRSNISSERIYPMELHWFAEGIYIMGTTEEYKNLLDARIITINGKKVEEAANILRPLLAGANDSWFKTQVVYYLSIPSVLQYFGIVDGDEIRLKAKLATGEVKEIKMKSMDYKEYIAVARKKQPVPIYESHPYENYWYQYMDDGKILYINYNSCRQMRDKPFEIFSKEIWDFIKNKEVEKTVIDIRNNRGGSSPILNPFIKQLKKSSFNQKNRLYVIIGKDTFSSAVLNALTLKQETNAYFIGEATGGEPNHYGEVKQLELPNSKIHVSYSTKYFQNSTGKENTIEPDKVMKESFESYSKGEDPIIEWIQQQK